MPVQASRLTLLSDVCRAVLQILILLFALFALATGQFHRFRISLCALLAVTAVLFCDASQTFYYRKHLRLALSIHLAGVLSVLVGCCILTITPLACNLIVLFCMHDITTVLFAMTQALNDYIASRFLASCSAISKLLCVLEHCTVGALHN